MTAGQLTRYAPVGPAKWLLVSATVAPIALVGGWVIAEAVQPVGSYDAARQTISVLAGRGAQHRWIMTLGLYLLGLSYLATAAGLRAVRPSCRVVLAVGGAAGLGVAAFAEPRHGSAAWHIIFATVSLTILALWPATIGSPRGPWVLSRTGSLVATGLLVASLVWVLVAGHGGGDLGVAERIATAGESVWPLVVVLALRRSGRMLT